MERCCLVAFGAFAVLSLFTSSVFGDCFLHNPRGSNGRLNESTTTRNNTNRLFDSQNNGKGGYCWGPSMSYYEGSQLAIEWTTLHGCGTSQLYCNIVIQYLCSNSDAPLDTRVRDGTTTDTISVDNPNDVNYGMHESYTSYQNCRTRDRQRGLFTADRFQFVNQSSAIYTRQSNGGSRYGYECPEERDYYPYWAPSQWRDIAILTDRPQHCPFYVAESQNTAPKYECRNATSWGLLHANSNITCLQGGGNWTAVPAFNISAPECVTILEHSNASSFTWTIPKFETGALGCEPNNCNCVLRLRHNISTSDLDVSNPNEFIDWKFNENASPIFQDPIVNASGMIMQLAIDTSQFGRTFQDRSHVFHVKSRVNSSIPADAKVYNLNVLGKRGNYIQTYPAKQYGFVPKVLQVEKGSYIHFQWTGCDTNPAGNAGEGTDQTDRSNIVQISGLRANLPASDQWLNENAPLFEDPQVRKRMAFLDQDPLECLTQEDLLLQNGDNVNAAKQDVHNCMKLNAAPQYFDGGVVLMNTTSSGFYYMSSRNNNFSNRLQKGVIRVVDP